MPQLVQSGWYTVREIETSDTRREFGVIRGDTANSANGRGFSRQFGFKSSKWYAYQIVYTSVVPRVAGSQTAPDAGIEKTFTEVHIAQEEFDSKSSAVDFVEDW